MFGATDAYFFLGGVQIFTFRTYRETARYVQDQGGRHKP